MMNKTISNVPEILIAGVEEFRQRQDLQSWSQAAVVLLALGINAVAPEDGGAHFGGSDSAENELWQQYDRARESGYDGEFITWLIETIVQPWGGQRENAGRRIEIDL